MAGFTMHGGDTTNGDGTGGYSVYGHQFDDEGIWYPHSHKGILSMHNQGKNTNTSQFFISLAQIPYLDTQNTVFGRIISGYEVIEKCEAVESVKNDKDKDVPSLEVKIADCGELKDD